MKTTVIREIEIPDELVESVVKSMMENFPEASQDCALVCTKWKYDDWRFEFADTEDPTKLHPNGQRYKLTKDELLKAFPLVYSKEWPSGCTPPPLHGLDEAQVWDDWLCQCDAADFDAFAQLVCLGHVIYG